MTPLPYSTHCIVCLMEFFFLSNEAHAKVFSRNFVLAIILWLQISLAIIQALPEQ